VLPAPVGGTSAVPASGVPAAVVIASAVPAPAVAGEVVSDLAVATQEVATASRSATAPPGPRVSLDGPAVPTAGDTEMGISTIASQSLPFTGLDIRILAIGFVLLLLGIGLRRRTLKPRTDIERP